MNFHTKQKNQARPVPDKAEVVIIGGGIIGASIAYNLAKNGVLKTVLLEKGTMGQGSTGKCAGGVRTQFSTGINIQFSMLSLKVLKRFLEDFGVDPEFHPVGYLFLACNQEQRSILHSNSILMQSMGLDVELLSPRAIQDRWPFLRTGDLSGGYYTERDGYAGPYEILQGYIKCARGMGAVILEGLEVTEIQAEKGKIRSVKTATGEKIRTPLVINAAGPFAARVAAMLDLKLPVVPIRRQVFFTDSLGGLPARFPLVIDMEYGWYMRREGKGILLSGPQDENPSFNEKTDFDARLWTAERSLHRVSALEQVRIVRGWAGLYEISPDNHAIIGSFPEMEGFICANGFSGHGFMHAPATGILVSELILHGRASSIDVFPLRPSRFREGDLMYEPLTAFKKGNTSYAVL